MNRRVIAAILAGILAVLGGFLLVTWVQQADSRAIAGQQPVTVVVVTAPIPKGTAGVQAIRSLALKQVPQAVVIAGALTQLPDLTGRVASVDLVPGEQVIASRFVDPSAAAVNDPVDVPPKLQQVSLVLAPERVIGAHLRAGDTVGVFMSFEFIADKQSTAGNIKTTHLTLNKVLVTRVAGVANTTTTDGPTAAPSAAPAGQVMVTLALNSPDAEKLVFAKEWGKVWLSLQREETDLDGARIVTGGNIYK